MPNRKKSKNLALPKTRHNRADAGLWLGFTGRLFDAVILNADNITHFFLARFFILESLPDENGREGAQNGKSEKEGWQIV